MKYPVQFTRISRPETIDQHSLLELIVVQMNLCTSLQHMLQAIAATVWIKFLCRIKIPEHPVKNNILDFWWQLIKMMVIVNCLYQINHLSIFQMRGLDIRIFPPSNIELDFISFLHVFPPPFLFLVFQLPPVLLSSSYIVSMIYRTYL